MKTGFATLLILLAIPATSALAQMDRQRAKETLDAIGKADSNGDGKTTFAEFKTMRQTQFNRIKRKDGFLDLSVAAETADQRGKLLSELDSNKDGKISQAEFVNHKPKAWSRLDGDSDGALSKAEVAKARKRVG
ncbi:MAG: EF-hand domain-containing protein [Sphingorhabdus sp.]